MKYYNSIEQMPGAGGGSVIFTGNSENIFREDGYSVVSREAHDSEGNSLGQYASWGADDQMPYNILDKIERDETLQACLKFNAEALFGCGLQINSKVQLMSPADYWLGCCLDFMYYGFAVTHIAVTRVDEQHLNVIMLSRLPAAYCRREISDGFGPCNIFYGNFRNIGGTGGKRRLPVIDSLQRVDITKIGIGKTAEFAYLVMMPTADSTYYPIPYYGSLFRSKWYDIKQTIVAAKAAKIRNTAPIRYQVEISSSYWDNLLMDENIIDPLEQQEFVKKKKQEIIDFLTGVENSGKTWFSPIYMTPDGKEEHAIQIKKIDLTKEGGDWESDMQEVINIECFTLGVHSNLVGSVPGKAQTNNSGSDKRELYTIAQLRMKPYRELLLAPIRDIVRYTDGGTVECPYLFLTTLDQHKDAEETT